MLCAKCGFEMSEDAVFCARCGRHREGTASERLLRDVTHAYAEGYATSVSWKFVPEGVAFCLGAIASMAVLPFRAIRWVLRRRKAVTVALIVTAAGLTATVR